MQVENNPIASFVKETYSKKDFLDFPVAPNICRIILSELTEFEKYSNFRVENMIEEKVRANVFIEFNPAGQTYSDLSIVQAPVPMDKTIQ